MKTRFFSARLLAAVLIAWAVIIVPSTAPAQTAKPTATAKPHPMAADKTAAEPGDEFPRPPKPAKQYTIGVLLPHLSSAHFVGQAYGYIDEAQKLGVKVILFEAGGYEH